MKLPELFNQQHIDEVSFLVMLCDPVGNEFQIIVRKFDGQAYFTTGSHEMGLYYRLHGGGIVRVVYARNNKCFIKVKDKSGDEVQYPTPPKIFILGHQPVANDAFDFLIGEQYLRQLDRVPTLFHTLYKRLTRDDVFTGKLVCFPVFFCSFLFKLIFLFILPNC